MFLSEFSLFLQSTFKCTSNRACLIPVNSLVEGNFEKVQNEIIESFCMQGTAPSQLKEEFQ